MTANSAKTGSKKAKTGLAQATASARASAIRQAKHDHRVNKQPHPTRGGSYTVDQLKSED